MISQNAKNGFGILLEKCLLDSLRTENHSDWMLNSLGGYSSKEADFFILTITAYAFKVYVILHFNQTEDTRRYIASALKVDIENLDDARYYDYIGEIVNTFCGAYKRELSKYIPYLGMSTPNRLLHQSLSYVKSFAADNEIHLAVSLNKNEIFVGSVYISDFHDVDFLVNMDITDVDEADSGELELF